MKPLKNITIFTLIVGFASIILSMGEIETKAELADNQFMVITVRGHIVFHKTGSDMKRGDLYTEGIILDFVTKTSRAAVANEKTGRFVITPNKKGQTTILPASNNISARAGGLLNMLDLKNFFEDRVLALDVLKLKVSDQNFPLDDKKFFYVKYKHEKEVIPKKLSHSGDTLFFDPAEIFKIDGKPITVEEKEMTLYYKGEDKTYKINKFTPVFPDMKEVKAEVQTLMDYSTSTTNEGKLDEVTAFLTEFYGKTSAGNLKNWLTEEFKLD